MLTDNLFDEILLNPFERQSSLYIVSGYASATMVSRHFKSLIGKRRRDFFIRRKEVRIELIVGMASQDGISKHDHEGFQELTRAYNGLFECRYVVRGAPVHAKTFAWFSSDGDPVAGFTGSANYTQSGFSASRREAMIKHGAEASLNYFGLIKQDTVDCLDSTVSGRVNIYTGARRDESVVAEDSPNVLDNVEHLPHVTISFLANGELPQRSGLNWGQRPEHGRDPNQAYIRVPSQIYKTDFFPPRGEHFTIITDDDKSLICRCLQDRSKAIHTPDSNSLMGLYFRNRLGVNSGAPVAIEDLERYGRTNVDFYKIDDETFFMDFSVSE